MIKKNEIWAYIKTRDPKLYRHLNRRLMGRTLRLNGRVGRRVQLSCYRISNKIFGFQLVAA